MTTKLNPIVVTEDDVLKGSKEVEVLARNGHAKKITVSAMPWRAALATTFKPLDGAMIHMLENCVESGAQKALDELTPIALVQLTNVAQQLTNGVDALKKVPATAKDETAAATPSSLPSSVS